MDMRLLNYDDKKLTPEARWLLMQWSRQMGLEKPLTLPLRDLRVRFEMPLLRLRQALACLTEQGVISAEPYKCGQKKGRPRTHFTITGKLHHSLAKVRVPEVTSRQAAIEHLLSASSVPPMTGDDEHPNLLSGQSRIQHMLVATRWLLIVLLAHADVTGSLSHLSYSALQRLTGLSRVRLRSQLRKLSDMGVLADYQGGRLGKALGVKRTSIIVLNLAHPALGETDNVGVDVTLLKSHPIPTSSTEHDMINALFVAAILIDEWQKTAPLEDNNAPTTVHEWEAAMARQKAYDHKKKPYDDAKALLPPMKYIAPLAAQLASHYGAAGARWLQAYVEHYAMRLLNEAWATLTKNTGMLTNPVAEIMQAIEHDCQVTESTKTKTDCAVDHGDNAPEKDDTVSKEDESLHDSDQTASSPLPILLYTLAHHLASTFKNYLSGVPEGMNADVWSNATFCLPPVTPASNKATQPHRSLLLLRCYFDGEDPIKTSWHNVNTVWTPLGDWLREHNASLEEALAELILTTVIQREWLLRSQPTTPKPMTIQ
tara:strand:+ start:546 stop:2168 length:1623 start_codon:yes stop_codon:yes gene_type:complete